MTPEVPSDQTAAQPRGMRQRFAGLGVRGAIRQAGSTLTKREAKTISKQSGKSVAEVMSGAVDQGVALGSGLVNQFNRGKMGPSFKSHGFLMGGMFSAGSAKGVGGALQNLQPLQGVSMPAGSVYAGSTAVTRDGQTTFNPVVMPKAVLKGALNNISGSLGYSAPTQSGTAGEAAASVSAEASPSARVSPKARTAKSRAQKMIAKRRGQGRGKQNQ